MFVTKINSRLISLVTDPANLGTGAVRKIGIVIILFPTRARLQARSILQRIGLISDQPGQKKLVDNKFWSRSASQLRPQLRQNRHVWNKSAWRQSA